MSSKSQAGYPNRRAGSCLSNESGHHTLDKWWTCCPPGTTYEDYNHSTRCQLSTTTGEVPEQCANSSSILWWKGSYFCCEPQLVGFANEAGSFGCSTQSDVYNGYSNETAELGESGNIRSELYGSPVVRELPTDIQSRQELPGSATKQSPLEPS